MFFFFGIIMYICFYFGRRIIVYMFYKKIQLMIQERLIFSENYIIFSFYIF